MHTKEELQSLIELTLLEQAEGKLTTKQRQNIPLEDFAWPAERKFPIIDQAHLDAAVKLLGRAPTSKQAEIKKNIIRIAKRKSLSLPQEWVK